jgi:Tol biopolymer transport system component
MDPGSERLIRFGQIPRRLTLGFFSMLLVGCAQPAPWLETSPSVTTAPSFSSSASPLETAVQPVPQNQSPGLDGSANTIAFGARIGSPVVQPDGTVLFDNDIFAVGVDGTNLRRLTSSGGGKASYSWSPDGERIVFRWDPTGTDWNRSDIAIVTVADHKVTTLAHEAWSPAWSPLGDWIAYYSAAAQDFGLYLIRPDGSDNHQILAGDAEYPTWSPDGRRLAFMSLGFPAGSSSAAYEIYVVDVDGENLQRLTIVEGEDGWPAWSHDGTRIAYQRMVSDEAKSEIHVMGADGQDDRLITDPNDDLEEYTPAWSPNDRYLAYYAYPTTDSSTAAGGIFVMLPDGSGRLLIRSDGYEPAWRPT